jgi:hypothetical protein
MAHYYGLPFQGGSGLDSCLPDGQAGYERMLQAAPMSLAGVNFIHLAFGMIGQLLTSSYEQAVIDNEIFAAAFQLARGIEVSPETLAVDQIRRSGPEPSSSLTRSCTITGATSGAQPDRPAGLGAVPEDVWGRMYNANAAARILAAHHPGLFLLGRRQS